MSRKVAVIGGGPAAVSTFLHLTQARDIAAICLIAPNDIGCAPAFGSGGPMLLCNTSVDVTSLRPEGESELLSYLAARGWPVHREDFVPRYLVTQYTRESFLRHRAAAERDGIKVVHVRGRARSVGGHPGDYRVGLEDGTSVDATDVVLALGGTAPRLPAALRAPATAPRLLTSPYPVRRLRAIPADAKVLVLGTKLSAIDAVLTLCRAGRRSVMASPSGQLPAVRTRLCRDTSAGLGRQWERQLARGASVAELVRPLIRLVRTLGGGEPLRRQLGGPGRAHERLRRETELAAAGRVPWQDAIAEVIDGINHALPAQPEGTRRQVLAAHRTAISRYISSIPLDNARRLLSHLDAGLLTVADAAPRHIDPHPDGWTVTWPDGRSEHVDWVVSAAGFEAPTLSVGPDGELRIGAPPAPGARVAQVAPDLRVLRDPEGAPERVWAVGSAAGTRVPIVNYLRAAAQQARVVGLSLDAEPTAAAPGSTA
ncbi:FAD/NAD(P)-binding protein [Streptomyces sp. YGL11-2]|uniref:FAD/NAD(P)-binding protein n=1 Tax=Streptomyces sp. YGL11-2 TaxID=3414028 RepID=UPI003CF332B0